MIKKTGLGHAWIGLLLAAFMTIGAFAVAQDEPAPAAEAAPAVTEAAAEPAAEEAAAPAEDPSAKLTIGLDTVWVLVTAFLVFWMNAGFGCVESGFCRSKNAVNILGKNFIVFAISTIAYWIAGFAIMFGDGSEFMGMKGFLLMGEDNSPATGDAYQGIFGSIAWTGVPLLAKFFFQLVFAGTAATIVSGCVAERIHYGSFMVFSFILVILVYPITGHWIWGGGWLADKGFFDFAGCSAVHSVGGWAGLAGILVLGPRIGKYPPGGGVRAIPGHSMGLAFIGALVLWLGWFGFNPGSTMAVGDGKAISHIVVTTNMACAAGMISATLLAWAWMGKPDFSMTVNGCLAGLVGITASCAFVSVPSSVIIGLIAGLLVVPAVVFFDKMKIDDPVGALAVHLVNGIWGTIAVGLFSDPTAPGNFDGGPMGLIATGETKTIIAQFIGIGALGAFVFSVSLVTWIVIKAVMGLRVTPEAEARGLDLSEMGMEAYPGDVIGSGFPS
jgi:Amt family ammonium transporter